MRWLTLLFCCIQIMWCTPLKAEKDYHVAVGQIVEHPALNTLRESLKKGLSNKGFVEGDNLVWTYENAQGNQATAVQIAQKLKSLSPTVVVTLSTPMTQAALSSINNIPIVFAAVTDPEGAKLTEHDNITGLTDLIPADNQIALIKSILPNAKAIGLIYNSGEANSLSQVASIKKAAAASGITVEEATVSKSSEVASATKSLVGKVDAILLPTDNTAVTALEAIIKIATQNQIPVFGSDVDVVERGAVAAYGVNWQEIGYELADLVTLILDGADVKNLPIQSPKTHLLYINMKAAAEVGVDIPDDVASKANFTFS